MCPVDLSVICVISVGYFQKPSVKGFGEKVSRKQATNPTNPATPPDLQPVPRDLAERTIANDPLALLGLPTAINASLFGSDTVHSSLEGAGAVDHNLGTNIGREVKDRS